MFHIVSEVGIAAGVRRIEAVTGTNFIELFRHTRNLVTETATALKAGNVEDIAVKATQLNAQLKDTEKRLSSLEEKLASGKAGDLLNHAVAVGEVRLVTALFSGMGSDELRKMSDSLKAEHADVVAVLATVNGEKLTFCCCCGKDAIAHGAHAGNLVREIAMLTGGKGGGKPDSAMAGGKETEKAQTALDAAQQLLQNQLH